MQQRHVFITLDFPPASGGVARYYDEITRRWSISDMVVLGPSNATPESAPHRRVIPIAMHVSWIWPHWFVAGLRVAWEVLIHPTSMMHVGQVLPIGTFVYAITRMRRIPYVVYLHGMDIGLASAHPRKKRLTQKILSHAALLVVNSQFTSGLLHGQFEISAPVVVAHPGTTELPILSQETVDQFRNEQRLQHQKIILSVGRLVERKGLDRMFESIALLSASLREDIAVVIIGEGPDRARLEQIVRSLHLETLVRFCGRVSDAELARWYQACDVFCLPARSTGARDLEGFGIVYIEANRFGKPVIAGNSGGVPEAVNDRVSGILVDPQQPTEIASALKELLTDASLYQKLSVGARAHASRFTWDATTSTIEQAIKQLPR